MERVYYDTNIFIYAIEGELQFKSQLEKLDMLIEENSAKLFTSHITLAECLIKPFKLNNIDAVFAYEELLNNPDEVTLLPLDKPIMRLAAKLSSTQKLKLPDSLHLATALQNECDLFITNDKGFKSLEGMKILQLSEI